MIKNKLQDQMHLIDWSKTDFHKNMIQFSICMFFLFVTCVSCQYCNRYLGLKDDWAGEEAIEKLIENKTGLDIDLTPSSPEKRKIVA